MRSLYFNESNPRPLHSNHVYCPIFPSFPIIRIANSVTFIFPHGLSVAGSATRRLPSDVYPYITPIDSPVLDEYIETLTQYPASICLMTYV